MSLNWSNLPEGVVSLVAAKFDGERSKVIRALRGVCKPWLAEITAGITKATMPKRAEAPIWQVIQKTPKLQSLIVTEASNEQCETLLAEIRIVKPLLPELKSFAFSHCELWNCRMSLSECLGEHTRELKLVDCSIENKLDFKHLTSLTVDAYAFQLSDKDSSLWTAIFTNLPSLQFLYLEHFWTNDKVLIPNLPNLTSLTIKDSEIRHAEFLGGLPRVDYLDLYSSEFTDYVGDFVTLLPVSTTA